ncbi:MAG: hypothetical protein HOC63_14985 [Rhodospirillales bacterium]|nr:hypothetical protein [Rhodospirillales bacterium]MBT4039585.1 hypothetical protein [Rhodospirillales bacterium]MBT4627977.1 hypothetical protein [Rhodospirillales bacterium]MBT5350521.1 hypothetical protein [Rhodospirillales bacterium]MBT6110672.1 hypothetical protein [Rhodospirillales bacterium]
MSDNDSVDRVGEALRLEFVEDFQDRIIVMERCLQTVGEGEQARGEALNEFRRELHNIKGTGGAFGFPSLSLICHRFEECLLHLPLIMFGTSRIVLLYLNELKKIANAEIDPSDKECGEILRSLPLIGEFPYDEVY